MESCMYIGNNMSTSVFSMYITEITAAL